MKQADKKLCVLRLSLVRPITHRVLEASISHHVSSATAAPAPRDKTHPASGQSISASSLSAIVSAAASGLFHDALRYQVAAEKPPDDA
ncbi:hypothetical protein CDD81_6321 [Ophiocordyceps australis]|uniref:Uncharacterized protein n=1 Tax=Ophiocordyceps australis TaxID=1399860 RepID=A0A2C5Y5V5_9HYPO|nr:hypothetical protein CDD81_6321 [Ophiocordyceps australis]